MYKATTGGFLLEEFCRSVYLPSRLGITPRAADEILRVAKQYDDLHHSPIADVSDDLVTTFLQARIAAGDRPSTINGKRSKILALWRCAWRKGIVETVPRDVPRMREPYDPPKARSTTEIEALLRKCWELTGEVAGIPMSRFWASLFLAVACTGERPGAVIRTRSEDVDLGHRRIRIRSGTVKTAVGRIYPLADWAVDAIGAVHDYRRALVWPWPHCRRHLWTCARRIMESAGIYPSHETKDLFYSLRRWNLSYLAATSVELARSQAGHSSTALTLRHYVDPTIAENRRSVEVLPTLTLPQPDRQLRLFD